MTDESFYTRLPETENFLDISDQKIYTPLPDDWHVAVTDVRDSTAAIERGLYKEVNLLGASSIMAMLNLVGSFSLPFVFGGDGATVCIPDHLVAGARRALAATRAMARAVYGLDPRVGIVPVADIRHAGFDLLVARYRVSENFVQAMFSGGGVAYAEDCLKAEPLAARYGIATTDGPGEADYSGLECRWKNVPSERGEIVSLIVQATATDPGVQNRVYREVIGSIRSMYGSDTVCHPVREGLLSSAMTERALSGESNIRSYGKGFWFRLWYGVKVRYNVLLGSLLMTAGLKTGSVDWGRYKRDLVANSDYQKFDDKLRQTLSGTAEQRARLETFLEERYRSGELVYGTHSAPTALVTCLIFGYNGAHIHLVDANNGGYANAARQMKKRLARSHPIA